jgi:hypothetical protein
MKKIIKDVLKNNIKISFKYFILKKDINDNISHFKNLYLYPLKIMNIKVLTSKQNIHT